MRCLDGFYDVTYSYRFGPPQHEAAIATLFDDQHRVLSEAFYFVQPREPSFLSAVQLDAEATTTGAGCYQVALRCDHFLQSVSFETHGIFTGRQLFPPIRHFGVSRHALPAMPNRGVKFRATLEALNLKNPWKSA